MVKKAIQIDEKDNVATTTGEVDAGEALEVISPDGGVILRPRVSEPIPFGHKLAIKIAVAARDHHHLVFAGQSCHHLHHARVECACVTFDAFEQGDLVGIFEACDRVVG